MIYERFLWFHEQVRSLKFPNARALAEHFEISHKTAQRDIDFIRDRIRAPLVYVPEHRGYAYEESAYEIPGTWLGEEELTSLIVAFRLAATIPDIGMKKSFREFLDQVLSLHTGRAGLSIVDLNEKVSVKNIAYSRADGRIFHQVLQHLMESKPMGIEYYSPHNDDTTTRDILPLHLLHYMGNWHIVAHCSLRGELRDFALSRIRAIAPATVHMCSNSTPESLMEYIRSNFGILKSVRSFNVCIRFFPDIAPWVAEQVWHEKQSVKRDEDGSLLMSFPAADLREIRREILRYGSQVEVVSPKELRDEIRQEIGNMSLLYP